MKDENWSESGENIYDDFIDTMEKHCFHRNLYLTFYIVTDEASSMSSGFESMNHLNCNCHILSIVAKRMIDPYTKKNFALEANLDDSIKEELSIILDAVKKVCTIISAVQ